MRRHNLVLLGLCVGILWPLAASAQVIRLPTGIHVFSTRFVDNGDGTVTDNSTGLMWEKTTGESNGSPDPSDVRNVNNTYAWCAGSLSGCTDGTQPPDGAAFTVFIATLNHNVAKFDGEKPGAISGCFANYCDWRLPTAAELFAIVSAGDDPVFGPTQPREYWSSTTLSVDDTLAMVIDFSGKVANDEGKTTGLYVRAVRGVARASALSIQ